VNNLQEIVFPHNIRVEREELIVESFRTNDREVVSYFKEKRREELPRTLEWVLKAGTIAVQSVEVTERIDYIQKEFNELDKRFTGNLDKKVQELDSRFEDIFGEKGKIAEIMESHFGENGKIVKEIFNPTKEGTPLYVLVQEFRRELSDLRLKLGIKEELDEVKSRTPLKGYDFEAICEQQLNELAKVNGDEVERTTDKVGVVPRSKKGDYVVAVAGSGGRKIVFEIKDVSKISLAQIHESLEESLKNRGCLYGVFVIKNVEALPQSVGWFNEYAGNQLVCALTTQESEQLTNPEILHIAYRWAKARLFLNVSTSERLDATRVRELVEELENELQKFRTIKTQCTTIEKSAKEIRSISDDLQDHFGERLGCILKSIKPNVEPPSK
jgi:hypothetical protein